MNIDPSRATDLCVSTVTNAGSQSGKSFLNAVKIASMTLAGIPCVVMDKQGMLARLLAYWAWLLGFSCKVVYASLDSGTRVLSGIHFAIEFAVSDYEAAKTRDKMVWELFQIIWSASGRDEQDPET